MADQKISQLTPYSSSEIIAEDLFAVVDTTNSQTKNITFEDLGFAILYTANYLSQSGGTMTGDLLFPDDIKASFGDDGDLLVYHDGTHSYVGSLKFDADGHIVDPVVIDAALDVNGAITGTSLDMNGNADFAGQVYLSRADSTTVTRTDDIGTLSIRAGSTTPTGANIVLSGASKATQPNHIFFNSDSMLFRPVDTNPEFLSLVDGTGAVFNNQGADLDFRIESDTNTHAFFLRGSDGNVGIGDSAPPTILSVRGNTPESRITNTNTISDTGGTEEVARIGVYGQKNGVYGPAANIVFRQDGATWSSVDAYHKGTRIEFCTQNDTAIDASETPRMVIDKDGDVGIGTSSPQALLDVTGASGNQLVVATNTNAPDTEAGILFKHATDNNNFEGGGIRSVRNGSNNDFGLALDIGEDAVSTIGMFISGGENTRGYVGIRTGSGPQTQLHVDAGTKNYAGTAPGLTSYAVSIESGSTGTCGIGIGSHNNTPSIQGFGTGTSYNVALCPANGKVAIGHTSPSQTLDVNGTAKAKSYVETYVTLSGTTPTITCTDGNFFGLNTTGNTTFTFASAPASGTGYGFSLRLTAGGTHTLTWPASVKWPGGTAPDNPASGETNIYAFVTHDGGTTWYGMVGGEAFA